MIINQKIINQNIQIKEILSNYFKDNLKTFSDRITLNPRKYPSYTMATKLN